ncbi:transcription factor protein [Phyllosticta citriasiana]|uniref:transcription factor protein n=1 Tax=Phyllosticta citriasiana TaxID=595635 RepID=UPI0030FD4666
MLQSTYKPALKPPVPSAQAPLPPGWTEHKAPSGHTYYYNHETKKSTYQRPSAAAPQAAPPQPPTAPSYPHNAFPGAPPYQQPGFNPQFARQQFPGARGGRGNFRGGHHHQDRPRHEPKDRPKHKYNIPGCSPWLLVKTKLGRRFVHNPETNESFWKFPPDVMKGVIEFDRIEREKRERRERDEPSDVEEEREAAAALAAEDGQGDRGKVVPNASREDKGYDSDEYEEVEVTDDEDAEEGDGPSKRQRTDAEDEEEAVEFNEDDIAWQLEAMGQYGDADDAGADEDQVMGEGEDLPLSEEDSRALFRDMLEDHHCNPFWTWEKIIEEGRVIADDRYTVLPNMKSRKEAWDDWSRDKVQSLKEQREKAAKRDPAIPYLTFLHKHATPKLYWPEFRRKYKKEPEMKDPKLLDKDREKWYREHIARLKLPESTRKSDLSSLLKSIPLAQLNRSTSLAALPSSLLRDLRYISLPSSVRDPLIEAYISTLPPAPEPTGQSAEEQEQAERRKMERERRENALAERERRVHEEKRRQQRDLAYGRDRLREEEGELDRAMKVGKEGLRAQLQGLSTDDDDAKKEDAQVEKS